MTPYWPARLADADNIRAFYPGVGWKKSLNSTGDDGRVVFAGCATAVQNTLSSAMTSTNLLLLTGAGSSFCALNPNEERNAPGMTDLWTAVEEAVTTRKFNQILTILPKAKNIDRNIEKLMSLAKLYVSLFENEQSSLVAQFIQSAERAILNRVDFVTQHTNLDNHKTIIRKLARRGIRKPRTKIFTTNYDLCYEYAAQAQRFVVIDGFSNFRPPTYDQSHFSYDTVRRGAKIEAPDYIENVLHLYKLHGSIDWRRTKNRVIRSKSEDDGDPVLIYPRDTKYQEAFEPPYLDMMAAFQSALREPDSALIISGFGFNDDHLSKPILSALEANLSLRIIICDVTFIRDDALHDGPDIIPVNTPPRTTNQYFETFRKLAELGDSRIALLSGRFEDLCAAIPDIASRTEREVHMERFETLLASRESEQ